MNPFRPACMSVSKPVRSLRWPALLLPLLLSTGPLFLASWKAPELQLTITSGEVLGADRVPCWDSPLQVVDAEGRLYFRNWARPEFGVTVLRRDGTLERNIATPPQYRERIFGRGWPWHVHLLGDSGKLLIMSAKNETQWCIFNRAGRLVHVLDTQCGPYTQYIYPDGTFVIWYGEGKTKTRPYSDRSDSTPMTCIYKQFSADGKFVRLLNRPPTWYGYTQISKPYQEQGGLPVNMSVPHDILFPDVVYHLAPAERYLFSAAYKLPGGGFVVLAPFDGWSSFALYNLGGNGGLYNEHGERIGRFFTGFMDDWYKELIRLNVGLEPASTRENEAAALDSRRNLWTVLSNPRGLYVYKLPWVDEPPDTPPAKIEKLDGFGFPPEASPMRGAPPYITWPDGTKAHFLFPDQDIPLCGRSFPAYSLWDYELSTYQRDTPGAVMGKPSVKSAPDYIPRPWMPVNAIIDLSRLDQGRVFYEPRGTKQKGYELRVNRDLTTKTHIVAHGKEPGASLDILDEPVVCLPLHAERPDILFVKAIYGALPQYMLAYETGADTKQFVTATVMTCATLEPRDLAAGKRATLRVHSVNWPDQKDTLLLRETAPGSRKFVSEDGSVVYELAWVMDEAKNLVDRPGPDTSNYLYFYITDPKLGLVRAPQIIWETGVDTGEYRSWAEPNFSIINGGEGPWAYKPWSQTEPELKQSQFAVEVTGPGVTKGSKLRLLWDEPGKGEVHADLDLHTGNDGTFVTTTPLLCFTPKGCDIGGTWQETESHPTPQIPGVVTFREKNIHWALVSATQ